jgi:phosphatidylinositol-3-phosphatase
MNRRASWRTAVTAAAAVALAACSAPAAGGASSSSAGRPTVSAATGATGGPSGSTSAGLAVDVGRPCVGAPSPGRYDHVVVVVMENKSAGSVLHTSASARTTRFAERCGTATDYHAVAHPSLPNYLALTSGSTHGVADDAGPSVHPIGGPSLFAEVAASGRTWATYAEAMPAPCDRHDSGRYAVKHNPALYYVDLAASCRHQDVPFGTPSGGAFVDAVRSDQLPAFALVVPDLCEDTHDCPVAVGDAWLGRVLDLVVSSPAYASGRTAVFVTWDEDDGSHGNRVGLVAVAPAIRPGTVAASAATHYSLLRTVEDLLALPATVVPRTRSLRSAFGL